jgi:hypothetical protein
MEYLISILAVPVAALAIGWLYGSHLSEPTFAFILEGAE